MRVARELDRGAATDALWAAAILDLVAGVDSGPALTRAIGRLHEVVSRDTSNATALNDAGVAHFVRMAGEQRPDDLLEAIGFGWRAVRADSGSALARFNLAVYLDRLHLVGRAAASWAWAARAEPGPGWADEAKSREAALRELVARPSPRAQLAEATNSGEEALRYRAIGSDDPRALEGHVTGGIADFRGLVSRGVADFARTKSASDIEQVKQDVQRRWDSTCQKFGCTEAERLDVLRARLAVVAATARDLRALRGVNRHKADSMADIHRDSANKILADLKDIKTDSQIGHPEIFRQRLDSLGSYGRQRAKLLALEPAGKLLDAAAIALGDEPKLRQLIIAIAQLRTDIGEATDIVVCDPVEVLADTLRILTVTAAPRTLAAFATVRLEDPLEFGFVTTPGRVSG